MGTLEQAVVKPAYEEIKVCRVCRGGRLAEIWDGGMMQIVEFPHIGQVPKKPQVPLTLVVCEDCWLVQLKHSTTPSLLYEEFWYLSGTNEMMRRQLQNIVNSVCEEVTFDLSDWVLDIGCNDGTMLDYYPKNLHRVGIEPAYNVLGFAEGGSIQLVGGYFSEARALDASLGRKYKAVTAIAMFYDLDDPISFCQQVRNVLAKDGVFVVQMNYLPTMLKAGGIDNVCHEHLTYFSLDSLIRVFEAADLDIYKAELNDTNGGSIRVYACHAGLRLIDRSVGAILHSELDDLCVRSVKPYALFYQKVAGTVFVLNTWLDAFNKDGRKVYAYGASTRGTTLLQLLDTKGKLIACAERDERKIGRYMVGADLPIVSEAEARAEADYFLVLPWHFWPAIRERESEWMMRGGKMIMPLPDPRIESSEPWSVNG